jgi:ubiquinone/menaquinone biosynthesis C-methylase UbiE
VRTFDDRAHDWDTPEREARARAAAERILDALAPANDARVLELGAGTGLLGLVILPHVAEVVLADSSAGMLAKAEEKLATGVYPGARTMRLAFTIDALPDERFDLVVSLMALHHVLDTRVALEQMASLLAPGGRIALVDLEAEDGSFHSDPSDPVLHGFDREALRRDAESAGFEAVTFGPGGELEKNGRMYPLFLVTATRV